MENARVCETVSDAQAQRAGALVRHREDAITPWVGAMTDRNDIVLRVRVTRKTLGSFETSRRRSKKPPASTLRLVRLRRTKPDTHPNPPVEHPKTLSTYATEL